MSCKKWRRYDSYQGNPLGSYDLLFQVSNGVYIPSFLNKRFDSSIFVQETGGFAIYSKSF